MSHDVNCFVCGVIFIKPIRNANYIKINENCCIAKKLNTYINGYDNKKT